MSKTIYIVAEIVVEDGVDEDILYSCVEESIDGALCMDNLQGKTKLDNFYFDRDKEKNGS
jgi:hypothetical protein